MLRVPQVRMASGIVGVLLGCLLGTSHARHTEPIDTPCGSVLSISMNPPLHCVRLRATGMFPLLFMNAHGKAEERQALKRSASQPS